MTTQQPLPSPGLAEIQITAASPETARLVAEALGRLFAATDTRTDACTDTRSDTRTDTRTDAPTEPGTGPGAPADDGTTPARVHLTVDTTRAPGPVAFRPRLVADDRRRPRKQ